MTIIFLISTLLLSLNVSLTSTTTSNHSPLLPNWEKKLHTHFENKKLASLANSLCLGDKKNLKKSWQEKFKKLGIYHLCTPSGLHLTSLLLFLMPIILYLKKINKWVGYGIDTSIVAGIFLLPELHSLKWMAIMSTLIKRLHFKKFQPTLFQIFIVTFISALSIGNYSASPLSYTLSFLFLGILCTATNAPKYIIPIALFGAQLIVAFFFDTQIYWTNIIFSPLVTVLFSTIFPIIFLCYFIQPTWGILEGVLHLFIKVIEQIDIISNTFGSIRPSYLIVLLVILLPLITNKKIAMTLITIVIIFHSERINNLPRSNINSFKGGKYKNYGDIKHIKRNKRGYIIKYQIGKTCYPKLYQDGYYEFCKY